MTSEPKSGKTQDIKFNFINQFKAWWDFNLSGSIPTFTLLCSSCHLVVVQVFIWFNTHHGTLYRFHWQWWALGAVAVKLFVVSATLKFTPNNTYWRLSWIKFQQKVIIGHRRLLALSPAVSPLEVDFRDLVELYDISVIYLIQDSHKNNWSPRSIGILVPGTGW